MIEIHKQYVVDENQKPVAVLIPIEEFRQIEELLIQEQSSSTAQSDDQTKGNEAAKRWELERAWLKQHRVEYAGQWVALWGNRLLAAGSDAQKVYRQAQQQGVIDPVLTQVEKPDEDSERQNQRAERWTGQLEMRWIAENRAEFVGQWVALVGNQLLAHGSNAKEVLAEARRQGVESPFFTQIEPEEKFTFGGWI